MNRLPIATLTWGTIAAAVISACLLAAGESGLPDNPIFARPGRALSTHAPLPTEPSAAGLRGRAGRTLPQASSNVQPTSPAPR